jgi:adenine-specific DNA-methyltransferase
MDGKSLDVSEEKLNQLKEILPEAFTENKIDWEKLKAALGGDIEFKNERYVLNWAGKSDAFRALQAPSTDTLVPCKEESVNFDKTGNIFIEGENLEVLKVLQKAYFGKIKMIYIDPPYNTGNDNFIYPDKFAESKEEYLGRIGDKDETGLMTREGLFRKNSKDSGHYHSNWLSMMYPRLFLARNLLRDDGVIFVSIDDNEVHNLRLLMNEVFGEENFRNTIFVSRVKKNIQEREAVRALNQGIDYIMCYAKSADTLIVPAKKLQKKEERWHAFDAPGIRLTMEYELFGQKPPAGRHWMYEKDRATVMIESGDLRLSPKTEKPQYRLAASDETNLDTNWTDLIESDSTWIKNGGKNQNLIQRILQVINDKNALVLDFFAGSCTTAHAVLALNKEDGGNRKYICVQLPEKCDENSEAFKAGYKTIAEIGKERIRRVIKKIKDEQEGKLDLEGNSDKDLGFKVFKLQESNFKIWRTNIGTEEELIAQMQQHLEPLDEHAKQEDVLYELLIKSGVTLTAKIKNEKGYVLVNDNEVALMLEKADEKIIKQIFAAKPKKVFTLDGLFKDNDKLKTNTALQMKDAGIEFKVI